MVEEFPGEIFCQKASKNRLVSLVPKQIGGNGLKKANTRTDMVVLAYEWCSEVRKIKKGGSTTLLLPIVKDFMCEVYGMLFRMSRRAPIYAGY